MEKREGLPSFHVRSIAKLLVGEQPCYLQPWLSGHYTFAKRQREDNGALTRWKADHTKQLQEEVRALKVHGWKVQVEQFFRLTGQTAILTGKPDAICQQQGKRPLIVDVKSGQPKDSDTAQVEIYQAVIPLVWKSPAMMFDGEVVYPTHRVPVKWADAEALKPRLFELLRQLASEEWPVPNPSESACRFCSVPDSECTVRWKGETPDVLCSEF